MNDLLVSEQQDVCRRFDVKYDPPTAESKVGIALQTRGHLLLNALRHPAEAGTCGWYVWWGDKLSQEPGFFQPLHVEHLDDHCPEILAYLALPPGWRV